ncbi:MAG: prephenate dehydratase [Rhodospirillaceae bacterium]|nr:prephenate dehydratase [Rhodospirillaceae bacterium]
MSSPSIPASDSDPARDPATVIAFQGAPGAYSEAACVARYPVMTTLPCKTFGDTFAAVSEGRAALAMIPIENSAAGRVADIHQLLPKSDLHIIAEHFERVRHNLLACPGADPSGLETVLSHVHALSQCRKLIARLGLLPVVHVDTAGAAAEVAAAGDDTRAAIASRLSAETYGLAVVEADIEDEAHNTTRFVVLSREPLDPEPDEGPMITSFMFECRNVPAALYKCLGGFATNGVNMTKLESYMVGGTFSATVFFAEVEGHPAEIGLGRALSELDYFSREVRIMGVYPAHPYRREDAANHR